MISKTLITTVAASLALAAAIGSWLMPVGPEPDVQATVLDPPLVLPEFELIDQRGRPLTDETLRGSWTMLFFGFTHCPDVCPTTLATLREVRRTLAAAAPPVNADVLLISVDPERDTSMHLRDYLARFGDDLHAATGTHAALAPLVAALGVSYRRMGDPPNYHMQHTSAIFLVDPESRLRGVFSAPHVGDRIARDVGIIVRTSPRGSR